MFLNLGTVAVYNLQEKSKSPVFSSTPKTGKHTDPVWQVNIICVTYLLIRDTFPQNNFYYTHVVSCYF